MHVNHFGVSGPEGRPFIPHTPVDSLDEVESWESIGRGVLSGREVEELNWTSTPVPIVERAIATHYDPQTIKGHRNKAKKALGATGRDLSNATLCGFKQSFIIPTTELPPVDTISDDTISYVDLIAQGHTNKTIRTLMGLRRVKDLITISNRATTELGTDKRPHMVRIAVQAGIVALAPPTVSSATGITSGG